MAIRRSKAEWQTLIEQQQNSHLSQKLFCQQQNVSVATFGYWKRKLQQEAAIQPTGNEATSSPDACLELPSPGSGKVMESYNRIWCLKG
ncbi:IS66 family insertion sequence element accessory protein TnpA [Thiolapillus sp.]|uniref:IS66 family insertion sequence element accessory protein TnpA n=1 Tax=Thiolapillus sp. TaxID=2017437 RepID=UPI003AF72827